MSGPAEAIDAVERFFQQELADVQEIGLRSKAGGGAEWDGLLVHFGLLPAQSTVRAEQVAALGMNKGALPGEVRLAVHVVESTVRAHLDRVERRWPEALDDELPHAGRVRAIRAQLVGLVEREGQAYDQQVQPASGGGHMGAIFANVRATKGMRPWANIEWRHALTIQCPGCGAPQAVPAEFTCAFCTGDLLGRRDLFEEYSR